MTGAKKGPGVGPEAFRLHTEIGRIDFALSVVQQVRKAQHDQYEAMVADLVKKRDAAVEALTRLDLGEKA